MLFASHAFGQNSRLLLRRSKSLRPLSAASLRVQDRLAKVPNRAATGQTGERSVVVSGLGDRSSR